MSTTSSTIALSPLTRIEGHLDIELVIDGGYVVEALSAGTMFRGFEAIFAGVIPSTLLTTPSAFAECVPRPTVWPPRTRWSPPSAFRLWSMVEFSATWCSALTFSSHTFSISTTWLCSITSTLQAIRSWRNLLGSRGFPLPICWPAVTRRCSLSTMSKHWPCAKAHQMGAISAGRCLVHRCLSPSGCTETVAHAKIDAFAALLTEITEFVGTTYLADVDVLSDPGGRFAEYGQIGRGCGNLLAYGVFDTGNELCFLPGSGLGKMGRPPPLTRR